MDQTRYVGRDVEVLTDASPVWRDRSEIAPAGHLIWVSDGASVWLLEGTGVPFPAQATACKWWTPALIPRLPSGAVPAALSD